MTSSTTTLSPTRATGRGSLWLLAVILTCIGLLDAAYLTYTKVANVEVACPQGAVLNCDIVQSSIYSTIGPIPIQFLGLAAYVVILAVLLLETRVPLFEANGKLIVFGMTLFGFLYSAYLTGIEAFVLHTWCPYCVVSAVAMTLLFVVSIIRVWRSFSVPAASEED
ncbi:MAG: vitamin K epoxide reductase family protein [Anaerolineae bacterium]|nr:vitamin K epoxide reductase family protein [Anaerolineae bacterium]